MLYPSWLRVVAFGETHYLYAPNGALVWLEKNEKIQSKQQDQEQSTRDDTMMHNDFVLNELFFLVS